MCSTARDVARREREQHAEPERENHVLQAHGDERRVLAVAAVAPQFHGIERFERRQHVVPQQPDAEQRRDADEHADQLARVAVDLHEVDLGIGGRHGFVTLTHRGLPLQRELESKPPTHDRQPAHCEVEHEARAEADADRADETNEQHVRGVLVAPLLRRARGPPGSRR